MVVAYDGINTQEPTATGNAKLALMAAGLFLPVLPPAQRMCTDIANYLFSANKLQRHSELPGVDRAAVLVSVSRINTWPVA